MEKYIEAKDQFNKFNDKMKQYALREFHNPEDISVLVRDVKDPITVLNKSRPTSLSTGDEKEPIISMIQTEYINKYL